MAVEPNTSVFNFDAPRILQDPHLNLPNGELKRCKN